MKLFRSKTPQSPEAAAYLESLRTLKLKQYQPELGPFIVLDTETSGMSVQSDRIVSAGVSIIRHNSIQMTENRAWFVDQGDISLKASSPVHGIISSDLKDGIDEIHFLKELLPILSGAVVVGHHIGFDAAMLHEAMQRQLGIKWKNPIIDTATMASHELHPFHRTGYANQQAPGLDDVCSQLSIYPMERHSAWGDAFTTAEIFLTLCARMRQRLGRPLRMADLPVVRF